MSNLFVEVHLYSLSLQWLQMIQGRSRERIDPNRLEIFQPLNS